MQNVSQLNNDYFDSSSGSLVTINNDNFDHLDYLIQKSKISKDAAENFKSQMKELNDFDPKLLREGKWYGDETMLFFECVKKYGNDWKKISKCIKTRTESQVKVHTTKYFKKLEKRAGIKQRNTNRIEDPNKTKETIPSPIEVNMPKKRESKDCIDDRRNSMISIHSKITPGFTEGNIEQKDSSEKSECKFLSEEGQKHGLNNLNEIFFRFQKLSDWVNANSTFHKPGSILINYTNKEIYCNKNSS